MDPLSQAVLGAAAPQSVFRTQNLIRVGVIGGLAGMAPDLDVLIRSSDDPLLFLEYHRQFTHSLIFVPVGAALCALAFWPFVRRHMSLLQVWLIALTGYGTHGLLDACTTYGTLLFWPFSNARSAWNNVSVIDPLYTLPLLAAVIIAAKKQSMFAARLGMAWGLLYLSLGVMQQQRTEDAGEALAQSRGHDNVSVSAKPGFGNLLLWKVIYEYDGHFWVDAVRAGADVTVIPGDNVARLNVARDLPWLDPQSQQARDLERFRWFSSDHLALDTTDPLLVVDMRYSMLPNEVKGLWGIRLHPEAAPTDHVGYVAQRSASSERFDRLIAMLRGDLPRHLAGLKDKSGGESAESARAVAPGL